MFIAISESKKNIPSSAAQLLMTEPQQRWIDAGYIDFTPNGAKWISD